MPKKVMDYSNTHFYKIVCKDLILKDCYVEHTLDFMTRKSTQKNNSKIHSTKNIISMNIHVFVRMEVSLILKCY